MNEKYKIILIKILKILSIIFFASAVISFITTLMYNIKNEPSELIFYIVINLGVTMFNRIVMAAFFFVFGMFIEEWLKTDDKE